MSEYCWTERTDVIDETILIGIEKDRAFTTVDKSRHPSDRIPGAYGRIYSAWDSVRSACEKRARNFIGQFHHTLSLAPLENFLIKTLEMPCCTTDSTIARRSKECAYQLAMMCRPKKKSATFEKFSQRVTCKFSPMKSRLFDLDRVRSLRARFTQTISSSSPTTDFFFRSGSGGIDELPEY